MLPSRMITSPERAALVVFPQQSQQERRYHGIDIDAEHVWRRAYIVERLDQLSVEVVKDVTNDFHTAVIAGDRLASLMQERDRNCFVLGCELFYTDSRR